MTIAVERESGDFAAALPPKKYMRYHLEYLLFIIKQKEMTKKSLPTVSVRASVPAQNNGATFRGFLPSVPLTGFAILLILRIKAFGQ
jgi:hypothetical protein